MINQNENNITESLNLIESLKVLKEADPKKLYIKNDRAITDISQYLFGEWNVIQRCLEYYVAEKVYPLLKGKKETQKLLKDREKWLKQSYLSFDDIHKALELYFEQYKDKELNQEVLKEEDQDDQGKTTKEQKEIAINKPLCKYFESLTIKKKNEESNLFEKVGLLENIQDAKSKAIKVLEKYKNAKDEKLKNDQKAKNIIKQYLESLMDLYHFLKPLSIQIRGNDKDQKDIFEKDGLFYSDFDVLFKSINAVVPLFNQTRNYLTKKPYSIEKYKLNFENPILADGWDQNKEKDNFCVLFKKDSQYFLGIMDKKHKKLFENSDVPNNGEHYEKMIYKLLPGASKMLPKVFFSQKNINNYSPSEEILAIRNHASHTKNGETQNGFEKKDFDLQDMYKMIDFYKNSIAKHPDWKQFDFKFNPTTHYKEINDFYREVEHQGYKITFQDISKSYIDQCVREGKLYLFQIYNKDFSQKKKSNKGKPNLHTMYWKALFDEDNLKDVIYKLSGKAELFYRKASISNAKKITHLKGQFIQSKKNKSKKNIFDYDIIKDKRFTKNQYFFHVPIECNFKASKVNKFNDKVNQALKKHINNVKIIGIDRGERHLAYYTVIDQKGNILKQDSLNEPLNQGRDYQKLLDNREKERDQARKSWDTIEKIKDLKTGYLSQVVHKITKLMVKHNAIVVFEDLNFGFKRGRFKVEKQVYQKLEKMLIDKLHYLIFKDKDKEPHDLGGLFKPLQLTEKFESFQKMGKQTGFIFYVPSYYTSKVCPATGFINLLYPRYETIRKAKEFFSQFDQICLHPSENYFEFHINYESFNKKVEGLQQKWMICSHGIRLESFRDSKKNNQWDTRKVDITQEIIELFKKYSIEFKDEECLIEAITKQDKREFFKELMRLFKLTLQMRNSRVNTDEDWMISPVKDHRGHFFHSSKLKDHSMPQNADANGAYHIALKGLLMLQQLSKNSENNFKPDLSKKAWFEFIKSQQIK